MSKYCIKLLLGTLLLSILFSACKKSYDDRVPTNNSSNNFISIDTTLSKGINLSNWFNDYSDPVQFANRFTVAHFKKIKSLGFTYVRIPIGSTILLQENNPSVLIAKNLIYVDSAIQRALNEGLGVMINLHPLNEDLEKLMATNVAGITIVSQYWKALATYFKKYPSNQIFFEVFNEPHVASTGIVSNIDGSWWTTVQGNIINAIREVTTTHYIIAGGEDWNSISGLQQIKPYNQPNIIYNFHFYDPFVFTHQGANWVSLPYSALKNVPYPSSPQNVALLIQTYTDPSIKNLLNWYGNSQFNIDSLNAEVKQAVNWATKNNVKIICNEFGAYKPFAPAASRVKFIADIRTVFEQNKIGWAVWELDEGFGILSYPTNSRDIFTTDTDILKSLGLL